MIRFLKSLFSAPEKQNEQKNDEAITEKDHLEFENYEGSAEQPTDENQVEPQESEAEKVNIIFPPIADGFATPVDPDVKDLKKSLYEKSQNNDGKLERIGGLLYYIKEFTFGTFYWCIIDTFFERDERFKSAIEKLFKIEMLPNEKIFDTKFKKENLSWHIKSEFLKMNSQDILNKNETIIDLELNIGWWGVDSIHDDFELVSELDSYKIESIKCPRQGYHDFYNTIGRYRGHAFCFALFKDRLSYLENRFTNRFKKSTDPFTQKNSFEWQSIGAPSDKLLNVMETYGLVTTDTTQRSSIQLTPELFFYPINIDGLDYITFEFLYRELKLRKKDTITFLFENGNLIEFDLTSKFHTVTPKQVKGVHVPISQQELEVLSEQNLDQVRVYQKSINYTFDIDTGDYVEVWDVTKKNKQYVIKNLFSDHLAQVQTHLEEYKPLVSKDEYQEEQGVDSLCYVYLMVDRVNGFYKIGISNEPEYRERTLQSEKPSIELITSKKFPNRTLAGSFEKALHETYDSKRLRGEWFELSEQDAEHIKQVLS